MLQCEVTAPNVRWLERILPNVQNDRIDRRIRLPLRKYPKYLSDLYYAATVARDTTDKIDSYRWCVTSGTPLIIIQETYNQRLELPFYWRNVRLDWQEYESGGQPLHIELSHAWLKWDGQQEARLWRLRFHEVLYRQDLRLLRMLLSRLHCEQDVLRR